MKTSMSPPTSSTDFPGETEEDLQSTFSILFMSYALATFTFFPIQNEKAPGQKGWTSRINLQEKKRRGEILCSVLGEGIKKPPTVEASLGLRQKLLVETVENGWVRGYGEHYIPIKYASDRGQRPERNTWVEVELAWSRPRRMILP
jgi:tRNA A37 methylthiotransferase MiaB